MRPKEICGHLSEKAKDSFLNSFKTTVTKDKERRKRKSEDKDRRKRDFYLLARVEQIPNRS